jgi:DNA-binding YbaB/EbfC family protein
MAKSRLKKHGPRPPMQPRPPSVGRAGMQQQVMQLQEEMLKTQESLKDETVTATSGGGAVTVVANGHQEVLSLTIDPGAVDPDDVEMLQDMVLAAVNEALERSRSVAAERMSAFTGGLNIPGLF